MSAIRVYRYGLLPPHENAQLVRDQMSLAHRYRNLLVEIERRRRAAQRSMVAEQASVAALEAAAATAEAGVEAAVKAIAAAKARSRASRAPAELLAALKIARQTKKAAVAVLRDARRALRDDPEVQRRRAEIDESAADARRKARAACNVYWGTYLIVEDADMAMRKMPLYDGAEANDPRFVRWTGEGQIGVQLQGGLDLAALATDTQLRIEPGALPPKADPTSRRSARRQHAVLAMRIGSDEKRGPIWARWRAVLHRPLPPGSVIKRAAVSLRKIGPREEWSLTITVDLSASVRPAATGTGAAAVDLGWRVVDGGVRVASWLGEDGLRGELIMPDEIRTGIEKADSLESIRDRAFDEARAALVRSLATLTLPEWMTEATKTLSQWRSQGRLAALVRKWRDQRFVGDEAAYEAAEAWRYHDFHLWEWATSQRKKTLRRRREIYRVFAADLARRYSTLVVEDFDLRVFAKRPSAEAEKDAAPVRAIRHMVAPSEARLALEQAFGSRGGVVSKEEPAFTTRTCWACESVESWNAAMYVTHACSKCGTVWDQDENAAENLLRLHRERRSASQTAGVARGTGNVSGSGGVTESRWARAKRMKAEKNAKVGTAREAVASSAD